LVLGRRARRKWRSTLGGGGGGGEEERATRPRAVDLSQTHTSARQQRTLIKQAFRQLRAHCAERSKRQQKKKTTFGFKNRERKKEDRTMFAAPAPRPPRYEAA
jgi:hypothetical protein